MSKRSLASYRSKRDFSASPEPYGRRRKAGKILAYCVQKHLASHLHYDFRLEHHGVLLSWAVPKGPSLRSADKRLARQVEDHPIEYGGFEGIIPSGYGAGIVMLWDRGTWEPLADDVDAALAQGELKFRLFGEKLKGEWVLVRVKGYGNGDARNWLLIKHRDEWSGDIDVAAEFPLSVKSGGDLEHILASEPEVWRSHQPARAKALRAKNAGARKSRRAPRKPARSR